MAIDTAEKRKSLSGVQVTLMPGVTSNAAKDLEWRQEAGWGYPGVVPDGGAPAGGPLLYPLYRRRRRQHKRN